VHRYAKSAVLCVRNERRLSVNGMVQYGMTIVTSGGADMESISGPKTIFMLILGLALAVVRGCDAENNF